jgi:hypothetical protein
MESPAEPAKQTRVLREVVFAAGAGAVCLAYLFRFFLLSGGDKWAGDLGDARLCMILTEHWWAVCRGLASFRDPNFFYPAHDVLGYSHTLLLLAPLYIPFRAMHFDTYLAFECTLAVMRALGFGFCHAMLRTTFRLGVGASLAGSALFTIANGPTLWAAHSQMWIVAFVPALVLLLDWYFRRGSRGALAGAAFLFGAVMFSEFYTAFFCGLAAVAVAGCWAGIELWTRREDFLRRLRSWSARAPRDLLAAAGPFGFWVLLLVWVYYPVLRVTGGRGYSDAYQYIRDWRELVDTGIYNWIWGKSLGAFYLHHFTKPQEARMGLPVGMVLTAAFAAVRSLLRLRRKQPAFAARVCAIVALASAAMYVTTVRFGAHSLWWVIYKVVPGASGLRVPGRINVLLTLSVAAVCAMALNELFARRRLGATLLGVVLAAFLIAEQINLFEFTQVSRFSELQYFGRFSGAPRGCEAFYVVRPRAPWIYVAGQVDGMILARRRNIPTINGYSGWPPPGWDLFHFDEGYSNRAARYFIAHGMWDRACAADMEAGRWLGPAETREGLTAALLGTGLDRLDFRGPGSGRQTTVSGWSGPEAIGTWTDSSDALLVVRGLSPARGALHLGARAMAFLAGDHREVRVAVTVNGTPAGLWRFTQEGAVVEREGEAPASSLVPPVTRIAFHIDSPRSPLEMHVSKDARKLGMLLVELSLRQSK